MDNADAGNDAAKQTAPGTEEEDHLGLERLIFFSDGVFAVAITLLALDIGLKHPLGDNASDAETLSELGGIGAKYLSYVISFTAIGLFWMGHHRTFRYVKRYDSILILLNLLFLMLIVFIPFPTTLIGDHGNNRVILILYALVLACTGLASVLVWSYAGKRGWLLTAGPNARTPRRRLSSFYLVPALFLVSAIVAVWSTALAWAIWWGILAISLFDTVLLAIRQGRVRRYETDEADLE